MSRNTITFQPTKELNEFIEALISSGNYNNQSEVVREGLRLLQEQTAASKLEELRQLIIDGENSPIIENWSKDDFLKRMQKNDND